MERAPTLAIVAAAGKSSRMGAALRKPFLMLEGQPILRRAFEAVAEAPSVRRVLVVCHPSDVQRADEILQHARGRAKLEALVPGGEERIDSVRVGALWPVEDIGWLLIHDGARPLVTPAQVETTIQAARQHGAALLALRILDTVKRSHDGAHVEETLDRAELYKAQTPQVFEAERYRQVLARAEQDGFRPTDDSALWERYVGPVAIVPGDPANLKITQPEDLDIARGILRAREHHV
jgi:2-C-methyl-D-erythritol 4-phosphate cytidylyltransferase